MTRIAINGFGRIGRAAFKVALAQKNLTVVAINDLMDNKTLAHLLQYDTVCGRYEQSVSEVKGGIKVKNKIYPVFKEKEPAKLPWAKLKVDAVLECTGIFTDQESAGGHLKAGAKRVIISAPAKDEATQTLVFGTKNLADSLKSGKVAKIISMASCTTNCIAPVMQVLTDSFGVSVAWMSTIHSYTADQNLVDGPHRDLRRARAAAHNMVPTTTGAALATGKVIPDLNNLFDGISIRVPTICASLADITAVVKSKKVTAEQVNHEFEKAVKASLYKKVMAVTKEPLVSSDFIGSAYSSVIDLNFTKVVGDNLVKVLAWYDNEWGYSNRLVELAAALK